MPYRLVLFDFDGTLADSLPVALAVFNGLAPRFNLRPIVDLDAARGTPTRQLLKQMGVSFWKLPRLIRAFQEAAADHMDALKLHTGLGPVLGQLRADGYRLGILSSNREDNIRRCLRANSVESHFDFVVGYPKLFGKAKALRRILRAHHVDRADVLFVGDELRDLEAGRKVRVSTAAVTWGFHAESLLTAGGATYLVRNPDELLTVAGKGRAAL
ncbi:HAD-IA family hydrolase [Fimbriiglobus ruber]|uniref:Phosphoglycolate phosphatase n=1 Tax=Fimbriiglobus ruber TaxID=1908690 RepID=A0A225D393_9BACT|nr:HAD-IA family hydrolase [Fimbriiglobus ruber]OWK36060.1 Phosphoglycolate phosphatase [Fimbriiglobus ruber]